MPAVSLRFYQELNDFLPPEKKKKAFAVDCAPGTTVKALIEQSGVPHTEVDLVLVNGESAPFSRRVAPGDRISVYPVFESLNIRTISRVRPEPLRKTRFVLDVHLGKLAKSLRLLGFDTLYSNSYPDETIAELSRTEKRIILTRDRELLKRKIVTHGYLVRSRKPGEQVSEVLNRFDLSESLDPFSRCLDCNTVLAGVSKTDVRGKVPEKVYTHYQTFSRCPICAKLYWRGTHWKKMRETIASFFY